MLNAKHLKIIELLLIRNISEEKLSYRMQISKRTLANYILQINAYFQSSAEVVRHHHIIALIIITDESFKEAMNQLRHDLIESEEITERRLADMFHYLVTYPRCTMDAISEKSYLSKSVVNTSLNALRTRLIDYNLQIKGKQNVGLELVGTEYDKRRIMIEQFPHRYADIKLSDEIEKFLTGIKKAYCLDEYTCRQLTIAIQVTIFRLKSHHFVEKSEYLDSQVFSSESFQAFKKLQRQLGKQLAIQLADQELLLIVKQVLGRRASIIDELISPNDSSLVQRIIACTIKDIELYYALKIDESIFSSNDIQLHIRQLINRLIFDIKVDNEFMGEIEERFPFSYELAKVLADNIKKAIDIHVPLEEVDFLSLYFNVYLEQLEQNRRKVQNVALITDQGLSAVNMLKTNLHKLFGSQLHIKVVNDEELTEKLYKQFDLLITTVKVDRHFNKVIYIENILDHQLLKLKIEQFLIYKDVSSEKLRNRSLLTAFICEDDIYHFNKPTTYEHVVAFLAQSLIEEGKIEPSLLSKIKAREEKKPTVIGRIGFPHISYSGSNVYVKIALLDRPLNNYPDLKICILIITPEQEANETILIRLYEEVMAISINRYLLEAIQKETSYVNFVHLLNEEMEEIKEC